MEAGDGCYLEVIENRRLVWTSALGPGFRPNPPDGGFLFTAVISMEPTEDGAAVTRPTPSTVTRPWRSSTPRWASTRAGAPRSTSSSR